MLPELLIKGMMFGLVTFTALLLACPVFPSRSRPVIF